MPRENASQPPPVMTWKRATPTLAIAVIVDLLRAFFELFWFFGPAIAAIYCASKASDWVGALWGLTAAACAGAAAVAGSAAVTLTATFGTLMAMAVGFAGWLGIGVWIAATDKRLLEENALWFAGSLAASEVPFVGALPAMTLTLWRMYRRQIKKDAAALKAWQAANADRIRKEQERQAAAAELEQARMAEAQAEQDAEAAVDAEPVTEEEPPRIARVPERAPREPLTGLPRYAANDAQYVAREAA